MVPEPVPVVAVERVQVFAVKAAVKVVGAVMLNGPQMPVPEQNAEPVEDHPVNVKPVLGVAVQAPIDVEVG